MTDAEREKVRSYVARLDAQRRTLESSIEQTVALGRNLSDAERDRDAQAVVRSASDALESRADFDRMIRWSDPPAADFSRIWSALVERRRQGGACPKPPTT